MPSIYLSREVHERLTKDLSFTSKGNMFFSIELEGGESRINTNLDDVVSLLEDLRQTSDVTVYALPDPNRDNPIVCMTGDPNLRMERYPLLAEHRDYVEGKINGKLPKGQSFELKTEL